MFILGDHCEGSLDKTTTNIMRIIINESGIRLTFWLLFFHENGLIWTRWSLLAKRFRLRENFHRFQCYPIFLQQIRMWLNLLFLYNATNDLQVFLLGSFPWICRWFNLLVKEKHDKEVLWKQNDGWSTLFGINQQRIQSRKSKQLGSTHTLIFI